MACPDAAWIIMLIKLTSSEYSLTRQGFAILHPPPPPPPPLPRGPIQYSSSAPSTAHKRAAKVWIAPALGIIHLR